VQFDEKAYAEYTELQENVSKNKTAKKKPTYEQLLSSINTAIKNLKLDPHHGDLVPRKYLPKKSITKYGTDKIFRIELVGYWRMLYTLIGDEAKIVAFILEYMDHDTYNKVFEYKKK
jgi:aromatic ring-opening dioxygenase LigB subunit